MNWKFLTINLKADSIVHFEGHSDDIFRKLMDLDVLLVTSDHEGLPMVLLEAMALQTPIIAHAVGGIPKLLDEGSCGILVYEHTASGYAGEIYHLTGLPQVLSDISINALKRVRTCYSADQNARAYSSEYFSISRRSE